MYYQNELGDYTVVTINNDGNIGESGFWKVVWDLNSLFETIEHDTDPLPESKSHDYVADSGGSFTHHLVNNAGWYQEWIYTAINDVEIPNIAITGEIESSVYLYYEYGTAYQGVYGSQMGKC